MAVEELERDLRTEIEVRRGDDEAHTALTEHTLDAVLTSDDTAGPVHASIIAQTHRDNLILVWRYVGVATLFLVAPGCNKLLGIEDFSLAPDADVDAPGPDAQLCYGQGLAPVCLTSAPMGARTLDVAIDTDAMGTCSDVIAQVGGPELCVIAATQITVSASVTVTGSRPLMLLATETITVDGVLDVSSRRSPARVGAGANFTACGAGTAPLNTTNGAGGGAGGTFGAAGATGGDGAPAGVVVNNNGVAPAVLPVTFVRGGCKAQDGGDSGTAQGGLGGASGGAVYLFAGTMIDVTGNIFASGAGAGASALRAGGGGGGAGGLIGLEAPTINVSGILAANGANGSGGSGSTAGGGAGTDGATTLFSTQPAGTAGGATGGGAGGRGATGAVAASIGGTGSTAVAGTAGGGGGGGPGVIYVKGTFTGTQVSPAPTIAP